MNSGHVTGPGQSAPAYAPAPGHGAEPGAARGEWNGMAVTVSNDGASLISGAADDMKRVTDHFIEKEISERKRNLDAHHRHLRVVVPPATFLEQVQRRIAERLNRLLDKIREARANPQPLRETLDSLFDDPTECHAALCLAEEELARDEPSLLQTVKRERERLEAEAGPEIQAGYNLDGVDADVVGGERAGREIYRRTILGCRDIAAMLDVLLERYGEKDLVTAADFLRRAVGADLSAATPSTDRRELETMNSDLYQLRAVGNFTREFGDDLARLRESGGKPPLPKAAAGVLRLLCKAKNERLAVLDPLRSLLAMEGRGDPTYDVLALTRTCRLAHELPTRLFADEDSRQRLLAAGQKLLDAAIDLEEEQLES